MYALYIQKKQKQNDTCAALVSVSHVRLGYWSNKLKVMVCI